MLSVTGFSGFRQLYSLTNLISENAVNNEKNQSKGSNYFGFDTVEVSPALHISQCLKKHLFFSWSYCLVYYGDSLWLCGFVDGKDNHIKCVKLPNESRILQASGNRQHVACVTEGGCWLYHVKSNQWKDLTAILCTQPAEEGETPIAVAKVCCGETLTALLTDGGEVFNMPTKLNTPGVKIVDISCGRAHILLLSDIGEVFTVGEGSRGQLGHGELEGEEEPRLVEGLAGLRVVAVACGGWHSCAVTADGDLYSWGWNMAGQLGLRTKEPSVQTVPLVVDWPDDAEVRVTKVACGARHTITLIDDGSVWGCGWNEYGQLALPGVKNAHCMTKLPTPQGLVQDVMCGPWSSCLIT